MSKRIGFVGIIIENRAEHADAVNHALSEFGKSIIVRTGVPNVRSKYSVITLVVDATTEEVGSLTGKLGQIPGVSVKSALAKEE
jgi:putative iron-only hydrogenase system regulator